MDENFLLDQLRLEQLLGDRGEQTHVLRASDRQPAGDDNHYDDHDHGFVGYETRPVYGVVVDDGDNRGKLLVKLSQSVTRVLVAVC